MFNKETYIHRRDQLRAKLTGGIILLLGNSYAPINYASNVYPFRQDSSFLYFFGVDRSNLAGIIDIDEDKHYIFGDDISIHDVVWTGHKPTIQESAAKTGISLTAPLDKLAALLEQAKNQSRKIHFLPPYRSDNMMLLEKLLGISAAQTKDHASTDLMKAIVALRSIKEEQEITEIDHACDIAYEMHLAAMKQARAGMSEREIFAIISNVAAAHGSFAFIPIVSKRGEILHNFHYEHQLKIGDLLLVDAGFDSHSHYTSDLTRVTPIGGKFLQKQREIYDIVLQASNNAIDNAEPSVKYLDLHLQAAKIIASGLKDLGLMQGSVDEAVRQGAHALFFPHGLGHMLGLDPHDMENLAENYVGYDEETKRGNQFGTSHLRLAKSLQSGFVLTVEPGIYFIQALIDQWQAAKKFREFINYEKVNEYRNFGGIRIEDNIVITDTGCRLLGKSRLPVTVEEVENVCSR